MDKFCRTCLRLTEKSIPLYEDKLLLNKIEMISSVEIKECEGYPSKICEECLKNINFCFNFRKVIVTSNKDICERLETLQKANYEEKPRSNSLDHSYENLDEIERVSVKDEYEMPCEYIENDGATENNTKIKERSYKTINGQRIYTCKECHVSFKSRYQFYSHKRKAHVPHGVCNICGVTLRADNLKKHIKMHSDSQRECAECGRVLKNSESLRAHQLVHKGLIFTCEICGKTSKLKSEHTRHIKHHLDPEHRKNPCALCGKKVRSMHQHMLSHTGERPHICTFCKKGFCSPYALKVHTRRHTNERPFLCSYCPLTFPQKVSLTTHLKSKHGVIT